MIKKKRKTWMVVMFQLFLQSRKLVRVAWKWLGYFCGELASSQPDPDHIQSPPGSCSGSCHLFWFHHWILDNRRAWFPLEMSLFQMVETEEMEATWYWLFLQLRKQSWKEVTDVSKVNLNIMFCGMHFFLLQSLNVFLYR